MGHVVITGVSRGLGRAMVGGFVEQGLTVSGCCRSSQAAVELAEQFPAPHRFAVVDVCVERQVRQWAEEVMGGGPPPDLLINNAAIINRNAPLWEVSAEEFSEVIDTNIKGVHHVIRGFLPAMMDRGQGVIVNFSSGWGRSTSPEVAPYCATKWAIEGLTQALAQELPSNLAAVAVSPGVVNTEMLQSCFGPGASSYPSPQEWAQFAVPFFLQLGPRHNGQSLTTP